MVHEIVITSLINLYGKTETDVNLIKSACEAIFNHGVAVGMLQGLQAAKGTFTASGEVG